MAAAQAAENHGDECGLTWYFLYDEVYIYIIMKTKTIYPRGYHHNAAMAL